MNEEQVKLRKIVENAIANFNNREFYLLENDLSERCICAKFAIYLQNEVSKSIYSDYIVDVEYNRGARGKDYEPKRLPNSNARITVDLVVHKRGYNDQIHQHGVRQVIGYSNLICIEMKKSKTSIEVRKSISRDKERLTIMTRNSQGFGYSIGFMIFIRNDSLSIDESFYDVYN